MIPSHALTQLGFQSPFFSIQMCTASLVHPATTLHRTRHPFCDPDNTQQFGTVIDYLIRCLNVVRIRTTAIHPRPFRMAKGARASEAQRTDNRAGYARGGAGPHPPNHHVRPSPQSIHQSRPIAASNPLSPPRERARVRGTGDRGGPLPTKPTNKPVPSQRAQPTAHPRPFRMAKGARASGALRAGYARGGAGPTNQTTNTPIPVQRCNPPDVGAGFKPALPTKPPRPPITAATPSSTVIIPSPARRERVRVRAGGGAGHANQTTTPPSPQQPPPLCKPAHPCYNQI